MARSTTKKTKAKAAPRGLRSPGKKRRRRVYPLKAAEVAAEIGNRLRSRHTVKCFYVGFSMDLDRQIRRLARREACGAGMDLFLRLRDLTFQYSSRTNANAAVDRIVLGRLKGPDGQRVRVMVCSCQRVV